MKPCKRPCSRCVLASTCLALTALAGCGPGPVAGVSPRAEDDPDRHRRAIDEASRKAIDDAEAERRAFRRAGRAGPLPPPAAIESAVPTGERTGAR